MKTGTTARPAPRCLNAPATALILALLLVTRPGNAACATLTEMGGSLRTAALGTHNYDHPLIFGYGNDADGLSLTRLRLRAAGGLSPDLAWEAHLVQDLAFSSSVARVSQPGYVAPEARPYRLGRARTAWAEDDDLEAALGIDRLQVHLTWGACDLTLGRQAINFSQAWFFNPLDIFLPFDPAAIERDYKPGVDALRADITLGDFSALSLVAAPGRELYFCPRLTGTQVRARDWVEERWWGAALIGRLRTTVSGWDLAFMGGKVAGGTLAGLGLAGEGLGLGMHAEASAIRAIHERRLVFTHPACPQAPWCADLVEDHLSVVLGLTRRFEGGVYLNLEYFHNGAGAEGKNLSTALARQLAGQALALSRRLVGLQITWEVHPLVNANLVLIRSLSDVSTLVNPGGTISLADEVELTCGALLARGKRPGPFQPVTFRQARYPGQMRLPLLESEFGAAPDTFYLELTCYF